MVTGAGSGIGAAIAALFAGQGARVAILDLNDSADVTAAAIASAGGEVLAKRCNVAEPGEVCVTGGARRVGGPGWLLQLLRLMPRALQDWLYQKLARNRYRLFGRTDMCSIPDSGLRARLME